MSGNWEKRWHPLLEQWVIIAATSGTRPWSGAVMSTHKVDTSIHDPDCYLCPRVQRAAGTQNPDYTGAFAFDNDFPSLSFDAPSVSELQNSLVRRSPAHGRCRVLCWSERHNATLATIESNEMEAVVDLWRQEYITLRSDKRIAQISIFENKGVEVGVSNLHPHGQIYATDFVSDTALRMRASQTKYRVSNDNRSLLSDVLQQTLDTGERVIESGNHWTVFVPYCARFSYETWIVPHRHVDSIASITNDEAKELAAIYQRQAQRYDSLFQRSAPNVTIQHNAPVDDNDDNRHWHFHIVFQPPLRDPERIKYLAGFESASNNIVNPLAPEDAALHLKQVKLV